MGHQTVPFAWTGNQWPPRLNWKPPQPLFYIEIIVLQWQKKIQPKSAFHIGQKKE